MKTAMKQAAKKIQPKPAPAKEDWKHFIFVNNLKKLEGWEGNDCLFFSRTITADQLEKALKLRGYTFIECYEISADDIRYYIFEPVFLKKSVEDNIQNLLFINYLKHKKS